MGSIEFIQVFIIDIGEGKFLAGLGSAGETMDLVHYRHGHWKRSPAAAVDATAGTKADKVVCTSIVARSCRDGSQGTFLHVIAVFFVCLHVLTKLYFAM